ncbi:MAG: hypothetical protein QE284_14495 [Rhizobium sp.]|nr:hypothetical protein [Rhizobium sp.]
MKKQVIEYAGIPVGITIPDGDRVKFIAVKYPVIDLDGGSYRNISELQAAIHQHMVKSDPEDQAEFLGAANTPGSASARRVFNAA